MFYQLVGKLEEMKEVDHGAAFIDETKLESRARQYNFVRLKNVERHLADVKEQVYRETGLTNFAGLQSHLHTAANEVMLVHGRGKRRSEAQLGASAGAFCGLSKIRKPACYHG